MKLEDLKVYELAMKIGHSCWFLIAKWNYFERDSTGKQLVKAADSIAANIAEGYGRYHYKENRYFNFVARGSLFETKTWLEKTANRDLISNEEFSQLKTEMNELGRMLNGYIKTIGKENIVEEPEAPYHPNSDIFHDTYEISKEDIENLDELPFPND
jgi:four helix bundle protein